jgi:hypothetical protein
MPRAPRRGVFDGGRGGPSDRLRVGGSRTDFSVRFETKSKAERRQAVRHVCCCLGVWCVSVNVPGARDDQYLTS